MTYLIALLSGLLTALPLVVEELFFLPWFSLVPLFWIARRKPSAYRHGLVFFLGYYGVLYHWFCYLYPLDFAGFDTTGSILVVAVAWIGMSLLQGVGTAFVPFLYRRLTQGRHPLLAPFAAAALWCVMEWLQTLFWFGVPWGRLAVTQYTQLPLIQGASLFGSLGLGFLMVLVNGFLVLAGERWQESGNLKQPAALVAILLVTGNTLFGAVALAVPTPVKETFPVAAIQGNIPSGEKWSSSGGRSALQIHCELTELAVTETGAKLVAWSETVFTSNLMTNSTVRSRIQDLASRTGAYIAVGAYYTEGGETYNAVYLFEPDGSINESIYKKRHLVPFGEYLPMPELIQAVLPFLADINMFSSELTPGAGSELFDTELGTMGALVCFDSIYETLTLRSVRDGAELMILSTNDSWYKDSSAVYQHNGHAVLRAVETGRSFLRSANTGISSVISEKGEVLSHLDPLVTGYTAHEISTHTHTTLYVATGNLVVWLSLGYLTVLVALRVRDGIRERKRAQAPADPAPSEG